MSRHAQQKKLIIGVKQMRMQNLIYHLQLIHMFILLLGLLMNIIRTCHFLQSVECKLDHQRRMMIYIHRLFNQHKKSPKISVSLHDSCLIQEIFSTVSDFLFLFTMSYCIMYLYFFGKLSYDIFMNYNRQRLRCKTVGN